jgi:hypothetical protein
VPVLVILHQLHHPKEITVEPEILLLVETHKAVVVAVRERLAVMHHQILPETAVMERLLLSQVLR